MLAHWVPGKEERERDETLRRYEVFFSQNERLKFEGCRVLKKECRDIINLLLILLSRFNVKLNFQRFLSSVE